MVVKKESWRTSKIARMDGITTPTIACYCAIEAPDENHRETEERSRAGTFVLMAVDALTATGARLRRLCGTGPLTNLYRIHHPYPQILYLQYVLSILFFPKP